VKTSPSHSFHPVAVGLLVSLTVSTVSGIALPGERVPPALPLAAKRLAAFVAVGLQACASQQRNA
jgi:hypothetical protein